MNSNYIRDLTNENYKLDKENKKLKNQWNKLKEWIQDDNDGYFNELENREIFLGENEESGEVWENIDDLILNKMWDLENE